MTRTPQVVVIGGGQAGLAAGYHLRRLGVDFVILDGQSTPGGAWQHTWDSLHLFSPAAHSSLPGRLMPPQPCETYPDASHVVAYLADYEKRYDLPVQRGALVQAVHRDGPFLRIQTDTGTWQARAVISATGTWTRPSCRPSRDAKSSRAGSCTPWATAAPATSPASASSWSAAATPAPRSPPTSPTTPS
ncbi:hypothetical protein SHKM778_46010 [Streptomyces sp. KM77-8]|uniref:FAD-dependent oxidoreductase n=1 Tax=Streptomyces haneummycinicus TaxID=3074435 RepID=A0AAT9HLS4_9ACTN